jgi:hypothetical protein
MNYRENIGRLLDGSYSLFNQQNTFLSRSLFDMPTILFVYRNSGFSSLIDSAIPFQHLFIYSALVSPNSRVRLTLLPLFDFSVT